ncbi:MAG TPA: VanZ family protein [Kiritimatiellia bacterium]|nr:VanZ family protein [Kiritimatiellia bacterium]HRU71052.1 VanZ family protein [Kiritimatiellia bacterium]
MNRWSPRCYRYGPAIALTLTIPALSLLPARFFSSIASAPALPGMDKVIHALMYAALSLSYYHTLSQDARQRPASLLGIAAGASLYGTLMECGQGWLTRSRTMDPLDALANAIGAFGLIFAIMLGSMVFSSRHE